MRRLILLTVLVTMALIVLSNSVLAGVVFKGELDTTGELKKQYTPFDGITAKWEEEVESGYSITCEYLADAKSEFLMGGGISYQLVRATENDQRFQYIPLYFMVRTNPRGSGEIRPFLAGRIGYNLYQEEKPTEGFQLEGGLCYGFSAGILLQKAIQLELGWANHNSKATSENMGVTLNSYSKVSVSLGIRL